MPGLGWGFWILNSKYFFFNFTLTIQKLFSSLTLGLVGWNRENSLHCPHPLVWRNWLTSLHFAHSPHTPPQSFGSSALAIL